jgi:hypothetical protein
MTSGTNSSASSHNALAANKITYASLDSTGCELDMCRYLVSESTAEVFTSKTEETPQRYGFEQSMHLCSTPRFTSGARR